MKERPILFSAPMVRAILAGTKTQTRRVMKPQPIQNGFGPPDPVYDIPCYCDYYPPSAMLWPDEHGGILNGDAGHPWLGVDRLWVKETFCYDNHTYVEQYKAEPWRGLPDAGTADTYYRASEANPDIFPKWKPSIFMPRWASRITLEIVDVRAERLNAISEEDAEAEGAHRKIWITSPISAGAMGATGERGTRREGYREIWEDINGAGSWALNPWVWAITFRRL